jgi:hypothetical protein
MRALEDYYSKSPIVLYGATVCDTPMGVSQTDAAHPCCAQHAAPPWPGSEAAGAIGLTIRAAVLHLLVLAQLNQLVSPRRQYLVLRGSQTYSSQKPQSKHLLIEGDGFSTAQNIVSARRSNVAKSDGTEDWTEYRHF